MDFIATAVVTSLFWLAICQLIRFREEGKRFDILNKLADVRWKYSELAREYNILLDLLDNMDRTTKPSQAIAAAYKTLGLTIHASQQTIKTRFRELAKQYHPDRNKSADAAKKFRAINDAYKLVKLHLNIA